MRKFFLLMLLAVSSNNAGAEWFKIGGNETDTLYTDSTTIIRSAHKVRMQSLYDNKTAMKAAGETFMSIALQEEYDCNENQARTLYFSFHTGKLGKGRKIYSDTERHKWEFVRPGSLREILLKFACKK